jgi:calcineurin-like phosphoesterase family protein
MASVWFTADLHLGHGNIIRYCLRPFLSDAERERALLDPRGHWRVSQETLQRHDEALLDAINGVVQAHDTLWVLGDFCWGRIETARQYRGRIRCQNVNLVWGNHDHRSVRPLFGQVIDQGMVSVGGQSIWLNHYPMRSWNKSFHGSWHLYGHVHGRLTKEDESKPWLLAKDVGVDACNYQPVDFDLLRTCMAPRMEAFRLRKLQMAAAENMDDQQC